MLKGCCIVVHMGKNDQDGEKLDKSWGWAVPSSNQRNPFRYELSDQIKGISRGVSVTITKKIFDPILKIDWIIDIFLWRRYFQEIPA